jgi:prepilin-type N-terminal cleavage/methylation domain-containing protein
MYAPPRPRPPGSARRGFTLVELGIVILVIGIVLAFILAASYGSVEQARARATQGLITKLEVALNERIEALLAQTVTPNGAHRWLAAVGVPQDPRPGIDNSLLPWGVDAPQRAEVIARFDQMKRELPDVFFIQSATPGPLDYPVNFAAIPYLPPGVAAADALQPYVLPMGHALGPDYFPLRRNPPVYTPQELNRTGAGGFPVPNPAGPPFFTLSGPGEGIFGASYTARAALMKSIGYTTLGTDGVDNNRNGLIDEHAEGIANADGTPNPEAVAAFSRFVANHRHETARSEILYALLVNGSGPLGASFTAEDFRADTEVRDTDNDGAPEFVDGWGRPLQFFRWPILHFSPSVQKGAGVYAAGETRANPSLDPAGQLLQPAWWSLYSSAGPPVPVAPRVAAFFEPSFTSLTEFNYPAVVPPTPLAQPWDRSTSYARRGYASKFLVLSGGADQTPGVPLLTRQQLDAAPSALVAAYWLNGLPNPAASVPHPWTGVTDTSPLLGEGYAVFGNGYPLVNVGLIQTNLDASATAPPFAPPDVAQDDITNHEVLSQGGGLR